MFSLFHSIVLEIYHLCPFWRKKRALPTSIYVHYPISLFPVITLDHSLDQRPNDPATMLVLSLSLPVCPNGMVVLIPLAPSVVYIPYLLDKSVGCWPVPTHSAYHFFWPPSLRFSPIDSRSYTHLDLIYSVHNVPDNTQVYVVSPNLSVSFPSSIPFIHYFGFHHSCLTPTNPMPYSPFRVDTLTVSKRGGDYVSYMDSKCSILSQS